MVDPALLPPHRVVKWIAERLRKRIATPEAVKLAGYAMVTHELGVILDLLDEGRGTSHSTVSGKLKTRRQR